MAFIRQFNNFDFQKMAQEEIYKFIEPEIQSGEIFPALRDNRIDFYYNGGCIYQYKNKRFYCNPNYGKYLHGAVPSLTGESDYFIDSFSDINFGLLHSDLKKAIGKKFSNVERNAERSYLKNIYAYTYSRQGSAVKVIDIEVYIDGTKCDMVLWDSGTQTLQFVEAKLYDDSRLWEKGERELDTLEQVQKYEQTISTQQNDILLQYQTSIGIMKQFGLEIGQIRNINPSVKLAIFDVRRSRFNDGHNKGRKEKIDSFYKEKLKNNLYLCFDRQPEDITPDLIFNGHYE